MPHSSTNRHVRVASLPSTLAALILSSSRAFAEPPASAPPPTWPGYNVPLAQPPAPAADHVHVDQSPVAHDGKPLAGYHNGLFFLRDHHDNFHLYIQGRLQLDWYSALGPGVPQTPSKPTLFIRRIRPEVSGEFLGHWRFMLAGDFGASAIDNAAGRNEISASNPGASPTSATARYAAAETVRFQAAATDAFVNYRPAGSIFNVMVGQMDAPFMLENRTSDKYLPFMERSLAVRAVGIPTNKEIGGMAWGETEDRFFYYSAGVYMGEGQNRPNVDSRFDGFGRAFLHPLAKLGPPSEPIRDLQIGASVHYGSRDKRWVYYDYPNMATQGAFSFWTPTYASTKGVTHVIPVSDQFGVAAELRVPLERFDLTGEVVYIRNQTREAVEGYQATNTERYGDMRGVAYYMMLGAWLFGRRDVNGVPGYGNPPRLDWSASDPVVPNQALQLVAKWEQVALVYRSARRAGTPDANNIDGNIKVDALSFGLNYWATRHVRLTLDYVTDIFPGSAPLTTPSAANRATAPGNTLAPGIDDSARNSAHTLHEILARVAIAL